MCIRDRKSLGFTPKSVKSLLGKFSRASLEALYHDWMTSFGPQTPFLPEIPHTVPSREKLSDDEVSDDEQIDFVITHITPLQTHVKPITVIDSGGNCASEKSGLRPAGGRSSNPASFANSFPSFSRLLIEQLLKSTASG